MNNTINLSEMRKELQKIKGLGTVTINKILTHFEKKSFLPKAETYCYSWDDEQYHGTYDSVEEALEDARKDNSDGWYGSVYIGTCTDVKLSWNSNEEQIIESMYENLYDEVGEVAECFEVTIEQELELAKRIDATVEQWLRDMDIKPNCYKVLDGHLVSLKGE